MKTNILILLLLLLVGCNSSNVASGSSTTVGNPMIIGVAMVDGEPLVHAKVYLLDTGFIPLQPDTLEPIITDGNGRFVSDDLQAGIYRISLINSLGTVGSIGDFTISGDTISVELTGTKFGSITTVNTDDILMIPGTPFKSTGTLPVPSGNIPSVMTIDSGGNVSTIAKDVVVSPSSELTVTNRFSWQVLSFPTFEQSPFAIESENGTLFIGADSVVYFRLSNGTWLENVLSNVIILDAVVTDSKLWVSTNSGLISMDQNEASLYTKSNSPLGTPNCLAITEDNGDIYVLNGTSIHWFNGSAWDSTYFSSDSIQTISALSVMDGNVVMGSNSGVLYLREGESWNQQVHPSFVGETISWIFHVSSTKYWIGNSNKVILWDQSAGTQIDMLDSEKLIKDVHFDQRTGSIWLLSDSILTRMDSAGDLSYLTTKEIPTLGEYISIGAGSTQDKVLLVSPNAVIELYGR